MTMHWCKYFSHSLLCGRTLNSGSHLYYTVPPALLLTLLYRPLFTRLDAYKISFLITVGCIRSIEFGDLLGLICPQIAVVATTPWDSYLIRSRVWTYPANVIVGPTLFAIPAEEIFFFVVQTYNTSLLYLIFSTPTFHPAYLRGGKEQGSLSGRKWQLIGQTVLLGGILGGAAMVARGGEGF